MARSVKREEIEEMQKQSVSLMPADLYKLMSGKRLGGRGGIPAQPPPGWLIASVTTNGGSFMLNLPSSLS